MSHQLPIAGTSSLLTAHAAGLPPVSSPGHGPRPVRADRGTTMTCKTWQAEAALRMLMNNLDPDVAERPDDLAMRRARHTILLLWTKPRRYVRQL